MKKVLVTGANGHIGSCFVKRYRNTYDFVPVSLRAQAISDIPWSGIDTVLHLSALVHQRRPLPREEYLRINTEQSVALAESAKANGVRHFVFVSTVAVYGQTGDLGDQRARLIDEESPCAPTTPYGESKYLAEKRLAAIEDKDFVVSVVRPPLVYGRNCPGNMSSLLRLVRISPLLPFKYPNNRRSMVFIDNLLHFVHLVIEKKPSGVTIPQDIECLSIQEIVETLAKANHRRAILFRLPNPVFRLLCARKKRAMSSLYGTLVFDSSSSNKRLGFTAPYSTKAGLSSMCSASDRIEVADDCTRP